MKYLIYSGNHYGIIEIPSETTGNQFGQISNWFSEKFNSEDSATFVKLDQEKFNVWFDWGLSGPDGAWYRLFNLNETKLHELKKCEQHIRQTQDVVKLQVINLKKYHDIQDKVYELLGRTPSGQKKIPHSRGKWHRGMGNGEGSVFPDEGRMRYEDGHGTVLYPICMMNKGFNPEEDEANEKLIAKAPELLEVCYQLIRAYWPDGTEQDAPGSIDWDVLNDAANTARMIVDELSNKEN